MSTKTDQYYIQKIRENCLFIVDHMHGITLIDLEEDPVLLDSMLFRMIQISENARKLTDSFRDEHSYIPWPALFGMRNRIVHDYGNVDLKEVFITLSNDIYDLFLQFFLNILYIGEHYGILIS